MNKPFTVKQASKILGFSTNTIYKYLEDGTLKGIRSGSNGRFRITKSALEDFLGSQLPKPGVVASTKQLPLSPSPTLSLKITRILLFLIILALILDFFLNQDFSLVQNFLRCTILFTLLLLSYQFGGVKHPRQ